MLRPFAQEVLVRGRAQREGLEDVPGPAVALEHRMVDHIPQICATHMSAHIQQSKKNKGGRGRTERLPINRHQLRARRPIPMRLVIRRAQPEALRIHAHDVRARVLDQVRHRALAEHLVRGVLREREDVLGRVLLLLVQPAALDADGVH